MSGEDPWDIPQDALVTPVPLIGFIGLNPDKEESDANQRRIWELFSSNRGLDRNALNFTCLDVDKLELPVAKPPRTSYEWFMPRGVLKRNWMSKHLRSVPSVIVLFFTGQQQQLSEQVSSLVSKVRVVLGSRQTKLAVVLLQDTMDQDTVTSVCTECSIPARAVINLSPAGCQLKPDILEFEETLQELANNYYHGQIKSVKSHRDHLNKATHLQLLVRHSFKIGFLSELKGDLNSAYKSYTAAYLLLLESRMTEHNSCELRCVAGILNYKICRLAFRLNLPRDAITQFRKHLEQWRSPPSPTSLSWEQAAWQSCQASHFAGMFAEACKAGQTAIQTQHPGIYYQLGAEYAISRRKLADTQCSSVLTSPNSNPLEGMETIEFYGQRPWRVGKSEPSDLAKEKEGIEALLFREKRVKHSQIILELLRSAVSQFEMFKCPRMTSKLRLQQAEELMVTAEYSQALQLLTPCLPTYRGDQWHSLTYSVLATALKCSFLSADLATYSSQCLELCGLSPASAVWMLEEQRRVWGNFLQVLEGGKAPPPEPSMTAKSERASVGTATKAWTQLLSATAVQETTVDISEFTSCIDVCVTMPPSVKLGEQLEVTVKLQYRGQGSICLNSLQCYFRDEQYNRNCLDDSITLTEPCWKTFQFSLSPNCRDVGKVLSLINVQIVLGSRDEMKLTLVKIPPACKKPTAEDYFSTATNNWQHYSKVEPRQANIRIDVKQQLPALVGEWFRFEVELENLEDDDASDIVLTCLLQDRTDPLIADTTSLSLTPMSSNSQEEESDSGSVSSNIDKVRRGEKKVVAFFLQASTSGERVLVLQMTCLVGDAQCSDLQTLVCDVAHPFDFSCTFLTEALEETTNCNTDESFFVSSSVRNSSVHGLEIVEAVMEGSHPVTVTSSSSPLTNTQPGSSGECQGVIMVSGSSGEFLFSCLVSSSAMLPQLDSQTLNPGKLVLTWRRTSASDIIINRTVFDLPSLALSRASLYAECMLPPYGVLRCQLQAQYIFYNRTQDIQEFLINIEPSDCFMFSGPKQSQVKLFPMDKFIFNLVIYPLICGLSQLPKIKISNTEGTVAQDVLERLFPSALMVVPREKKDIQRKLIMDKFVLSEPYILENLPYTKCK